MITTFDQLKTHIDEEIWNPSSKRSSPTLQSAADPEATEAGISAMDVAEVITAILTETEELQFEPVYSNPFSEVEMNRPFAWAKRKNGRIQIFRLHHENGYCRGASDMEAAFLSMAHKQYEAQL